MQSEGRTTQSRVLAYILAIAIIGAAFWLYAMVRSVNQKVNRLAAPEITANADGQLTLTTVDGKTIDVSELIDQKVQAEVAAQTPDEPSTGGGTPGDSGSGATPPSTDTGTDADNQTLSVTGNSLTISGGNSVALPQQSFVEEDAIIGNEVTSATTGKGLARSGSGTALDPYTLGLQICAANEILKYNNSNEWACAADAGGASYIAGNGLQLTGAQFAVNSPTCAGTDKLQWNGTAFVCAADQNTTYSASGNGIELTGTSFGLELNGASLLNGSSGLSLNVGNANAWSALQTFDAGATVSAGQTLTVNGDAFTDLTGSGLTISGGSLQAALGSDIDLSSAEVTNTLPIARGGTNLGSLGGADQLLGVNAAGTALEYKNLASLFTAGSGINISGTTNLTISATGGGSCTASSTFACDGGNTLGATLDLGTTDAQALNFMTNNATVATLASGGAATFQNTADSTTAFRVLNATGGGSVPQFVIDTSNSRVYVGNPSSDTTGALLVLDIKSDAGDPTGLAGGMYYNATAQKMRCYEGDGYWVDCRPSIRSSYFYSDDFLGNVTGNATGPVLKSTTSTGANVGGLPAVGRPGILEQSTSNSATGRAAMVTGTTDTLILGNGEPWRTESAVRFPVLSDGTERFTYRNGFIDGVTGESTDGCFFKYVDDQNSGEWQGICRNNSTETACDTNVAVVAATWYKLEVIANAAGTSVDFKINNTSRCQVTSNIPTTAARATGFGTMIIKSLGTTNRTAEVDYFEVNAQLSSTR